MTTEPHAESARLFRAYVAGFLASGEGFNGEYPYDDGEKDPSADLREGFDYWLAHKGGEAAGPHDHSDGSPS